MHSSPRTSTRRSPAKLIVAILLALAAALTLSACQGGGTSSSQPASAAAGPSVVTDKLPSITEENAACAAEPPNGPNQVCPSQVNGGETVYAEAQFIRNGVSGTVLLARTKVTTKRIDPDQVELKCVAGGPTIGFTAIVPSGVQTHGDDATAVGFPVTIR